VKGDCKCFKLTATSKSHEQAFKVAGIRVPQVGLATKKCRDNKASEQQLLKALLSPRLIIYGDANCKVQSLIVKLLCAHRTS